MHEGMLHFHLYISIIHGIKTTQWLVLMFGILEFLLYDLGTLASLHHCQLPTWLHLCFNLYLFTIADHFLVLRSSLLKQNKKACVFIIFLFFTSFSIPLGSVE